MLLAFKTKKNYWFLVLYSQKLIMHETFSSIFQNVCKNVILSNLLIFLFLGWIIMKCNKLVRWQSQMER